MFYKIIDKKSIVNYLYHYSVVGGLAIGYSMLSKKILKIPPPSIQKFEMKDVMKSVVIVTASEITREFLVKQKIIPENINV